MTGTKIAKEQVRKFLIDRFLLRYNKYRKVKLIEFEHIAPLECIQIDPLRIVEKNPDLVLHNRFDNYHPAMLTDIAYKQRKLIEAWFNALCYVPTEEYRYHLIKHKALDKRYFQGLQNFTKGKDILKYVAHIKKEIKKKGALSASHFETEERVEWGYGSVLKMTTAALDYMWYSGQLVTDHRENGKRFYNLPENVIPPDVIGKTPGIREYRDFMLRKHFRTYRLGDTRHFRFGHDTMKAAERKKLVEPYIKSGEIFPLEIENVRQVYLIGKDDLPILQNSADIKSDNRVRFLAPLDNLIFNREMIADIFDFQYRWEVYAPKAKRRYGYYVMPILYKFDFIGRIDPKADRKKSVLEFNLIQIEDRIKITSTLVREIISAAKKMARFSGMTDIAFLKTVPENLKGILTKAL